MNLGSRIKSLFTKGDKPEHLRRGIQKDLSEFFEGLTIPGVTDLEDGAEESIPFDEELAHAT